MCAGDPDLRQRLETLLAAHQKAGELPPPGASGVAATIKLELADSEDEAVGKTIGRYKVLEKVGEGGCGVVYVAEQTEPVRRRVALKVIKLGMDTKQVVARFEAERQALAMMDHPNIAKALDAGATENGRPYFVMELVRGIKITEYCDQNTLTTKERIDLFIKVCQAIQHAHQKGIIHRDIKPSNILVTLHDGAPIPKVIDFGIAKATEGRLTDATVYTQLHQFVGTPAYMSPEQAEMSGLDIDTRSDIYSLGVLLYELLAGSTPFDADELMSQGIDAMRKTIREKEPVRPSTRLATLLGEELTTTAKRRSADTSKLLHQLKGDLDWIVMKCLEKDRTRRYDTANGLAFDLKRHLDNEPVLARPPSAAYKFQKAFRRNKLIFAAGTTVVIALVAGLCVAGVGLRQAVKGRETALAAQAGEEAQRRQAQQAQADEARLRREAETEDLTARQRAYASDMNVAQQALEGNNLGRALDLLNRQRPLAGQRDLRGWEWRYLWQQTHSDALFTLCQESGEINSLAVSPDGLWLAVGPYHKGGLTVWDLRTRQELFHLAKEEGFVRAAFSPTEPLLALTSIAYLPSREPRSSLRLWNMATRQMIAEAPLDPVDCMGLAFAKDGRTLVTSTAKGHITVWRVPDATKLSSYSSEQPDLGPSTEFAATPDLSVAACGLPQGRLRVMDLRDGRELWTVAAGKVFVTAVAFSSDGKILASAAGFGESDIRLWEVATGKEVGRLEGHNSWVSSLVFSSDGKKLTSSSADQTIRLWDIASRKCLDVLRCHRQEVWRLAVLPDGHTLISGGKDGTVCFWDTSIVHPRQPRIILPANVVTWRFAPDSRSILTVDQQRQMSRWSGSDFQQPEPLMAIGTTTETARSPDSYQFSRDGRWLAVGFDQGVVQIWDVSRRVLLHQWTNTTGYVIPSRFIADGDKLIGHCSGDNLVHEWDSTTGQELQSWSLPLGHFDGALDCSPDERWCVALEYGGNSLLRNLADESLRNLDLEVMEAANARYSPDGKLLAVASDLGFVHVFDTATWRREATVGGFFNAAHSVAFSIDGKRLAAGSGGKEAVKLFDTESWQEVLTLDGEGYDNQSLACSPDGNIIGWLNSSGGLHLWRAPSWEEIKVAETKDPPLQGNGGKGKTEAKEP